MSRTWIVCVSLCLVAGAANAKPSQRELAEAKRRFAKANTLYDGGRYEEALRVYLAAYELVPSLDILFNVGLAREKILDHEGCALSFRQYLERSSEGDPLRERAEAGFERCQKRARIAVKISSIPSGAAIRLGEEGKSVFRGRTPRDLMLAPGTYRIAVELPGYSPLSQEVRVAIGSRPEVDFPLEKLSTLSVEADVAGASASIGDDPPEPLPFEREVRAGSYDVRVFKEGFREVVRKVQIDSGERSTLVVSLQPLPVKRFVTVKAGVRAQVLVGGKERGVTPLSLELSPGTHDIEVRAGGRRTLARSLLVPQQRDLALEVELARERTDTERAVFWGLLGGAGAAAAAATVFGVLAFSDKAAFEDRPSLMTADRGRARARTADLLWSTAFALGVGAALQYVATSRESSASAR